MSSSTTVGSAERPLRVAVVGSGPAGVYAADILTKSEAVKSGELTVSIDLFDRYPAPYGLIRYGVAPDPESLGITALHGCARNDERELAAWLIVQGADVEARGCQWDRDGQTPLQLARTGEHREIAAMLEKAGARR